LNNLIGCDRRPWRAIDAARDHNRCSGAVVRLTLHALLEVVLETPDTA
jgi:hypothetical protein